MNRYTSIASISIALVYSNLASQAALVGWWDFEEGSGTTTADQSGGGHTGTLGTGATWSTTEFAPAVGGSTASIFFDGTDLAHVIMNGYKAPEVGGTNSRTLAAWIKSAPGVTPAASNLGIFGFGANVAGQKWNFRTQQNNGPIDGNIRVEVNGGYIIGSTVVIDGEWHHVAMTWEDDGTPNVLDVLLYVDGELETISASLDEPVNTNTTTGIDLSISDDHSNREWNGWLDDIRIYDEVLSAEEILALATGTAPVVNSFTSDAESIAVGGTVTLSWEVDPAFDTLTIDNGVGDVAPNTTDGSGSIDLMPVATTTYTLTGTRGGDTQSRELTVLAGEAPIINSFEITGSATIVSGGSATLKWSTFGADSLSIAPAPGDVTGMVETIVMPLVTTVYTLSATNDAGTTISDVTVTIREPSLIAQYNFTTEPMPSALDESPGGANSVDVTFGATSPLWLAEDSGRSGVMSFDDSAGGFIQLVAPPAVPFPGEGFTVMLWAKSDQLGQGEFGTLFGNGQGATNHFQIDADGAGNWRVRDSGSVNTPFGPIVDEWTHLALTWDGSNRVMYYNGVPVGAASPSNPGSTFDEYRIGMNRANDANGPVDAEIDDVRVYDFALDEAGILAAMNDSSAVPFEVTSIVHTPEGVTLTWNSIPGRSYSVDTITDLATGTWAELTDGVLSEGSETEFFDNVVAPGASSLYYRVREE